MRTITEIIIHCTATDRAQKVTVEDIDRWHKQRGWLEIGYHYVIHQNGVTEKGRDDEKIGAHCLGHNQSSIGICYVGGYDKESKQYTDTRTPAQKTAMLDLILLLVTRYPSITAIHGHNYYNHLKECPCFDVEKEFVGINHFLAEIEDNKGRKSPCDSTSVDSDSTENIQSSLFDDALYGERAEDNKIINSKNQNSMEKKKIWTIVWEVVKYVVAMLLGAGGSAALMM